MSHKEKYNMPEAVVVMTRLKVIACKKCPKGFTKRKEYKLHKLEHDLVDMKKRRKEKNKAYNYATTSEGFEKRLQCEECALRFVEMSTLEAHSALHKPFPYICSCEIGFYAKEDLISHKEIVHKDVIEREPKRKKHRNMILIGSKKTKTSLNSCRNEI